MGANKGEAETSHIEFNSKFLNFYFHNILVISTMWWAVSKWRKNYNQELGIVLVKTVTELKAKYL